MKFECLQRGVALVLVMWLVAALTITVGAIVSVTRGETELMATRLSEARVHAVGRGVARLVMLDRASQLEQQSAFADQNSAVTVFRQTYFVDGLSVDAAVYPSAGFISIGEPDEEVWSTLLSGLGGMNQQDAMMLAPRIVDSGLSAGGVGGGAGNFSFAAIRARKQGGNLAGFAEQLLGVEGMTRDVYDRVRSSVAPFPASGELDTSALAPELQESFGGNAAVEDALSSPTAESQGGNFCVEILMGPLDGSMFRQRVWVQSNGYTEDGSLQIVRVERVVRSHFSLESQG